MAQIEVFKGWADTIRQDIDGFKAVLESDKADEEARELAAGVLIYLVSKMDLIPDWSDGIGVIDDVMVLRVAALLSHDLGRGPLPAQVEATLERLANQIEPIKEFVGGPLYDRLKAHCARLGKLSVRGRTASQLVSSAEARASFYEALDEELKKTVPIVISNPKDAELRLKSYLTHKLQ